MRIEAPVGIVIDSAAGGTHEDRADHEDDEQPPSGLPRPAIHNAHNVGHNSSQMPMGRSKRVS